MMSSNISPAQVQITISGIGFAVANISIGLNVGTAAYLSVRAARGANVVNYGVCSYLTADGNSGSLVVGHAQTEWFNVTEEAYRALQLGNIQGRGFTIDIEVTNTLLGAGVCDVSVKLIDSEGRGVTLIEAFNIRSKGGQIDGTSIRGKLRYIPNTKLLQKPVRSAALSRAKLL